MVIHKMNQSIYISEESVSVLVCLCVSLLVRHSLSCPDRWSYDLDFSQKIFLAWRLYLRNRAHSLGPIWTRIKVQAMDQSRPRAVGPSYTLLTDQRTVVKDRKKLELI